MLHTWLSTSICDDAADRNQLHMQVYITPIAGHLSHYKPRNSANENTTYMYRFTALNEKRVDKTFHMVILYSS